MQPGEEVLEAGAALRRGAGFAGLAVAAGLGVKGLEMVAVEGELQVGIHLGAFLSAVGAGFPAVLMVRRLPSCGHRRGGAGGDGRNGGGAPGACLNVFHAGLWVHAT